MTFSGVDDAAAPPKRGLNLDRLKKLLLVLVTVGTKIAQVFLIKIMLIVIAKEQHFRPCWYYWYYQKHQ